MSIPLRITFRHIDHSDAVEAYIRERADKLERFADRITDCRVVVEAPHRSHQKGNHFQVTIDLQVPGHELVVDRSPDKHDAHEDIYIAVREAFDHVIREMEKLQAKQRDKHRNVG